MKSLFSVLCKQTAAKRVKEETGNFYWKQLYLLVHFTKLTSMFKSRDGVPFVCAWEPLVLIYPLPGYLRWSNSSPKSENGNIKLILVNFGFRHCKCADSKFYSKSNSIHSWFYTATVEEKNLKCVSSYWMISSLVTENKKSIVWWYHVLSEEKTKQKKSQQYSLH